MIQNDKSRKKYASHALIVAYFQKHGVQGIMNAYTKEGLKKLLNAYGLQFRSSANKKCLVQLLIQALDTQTCIPYSCYVYDLQATSSSSNRRVILRFRRVS